MAKAKKELRDTVGGRKTITVKMKPIDVKTITVKIVGDTPLISHKFSDRSKTSILDKQTGKAKQAKEFKKPQQDYEDCIYRMADGSEGFPVAAFKMAAVRASKSVDGMNMTDTKQMFFIMGPLVKIKGKSRMREDMVRLNKTIADIRFRAEYPEWSCMLTIKYDANRISPEQIANLLNIAGFGIGAGDWRPEKNGTFGMYHVG